MITLSDKDARKRRHLAGDGRRAAAGHRNHPRHPAAADQGDGLGRDGTSLAPVSVLVYGKDLNIAELDRAGRSLDVASQTQGMYQVATSWDMMPAVLQDRGRSPSAAQAWGCRPDDIAQQAYYALQGRPHQRIVPPAQPAAGHHPGALRAGPATATRPTWRACTSPPRTAARCR